MAWPVPGIGFANVSLLVIMVAVVINPKRQVNLLLGGAGLPRLAWAV